MNTKDAKYAVEKLTSVGEIELIELRRRADIAEDLARALDMAIENSEQDSAYVWSEVFRIRDNYRSITP